MKYRVHSFFPRSKIEMFSLIIISAFFISSCKKEHLFDCFKSSGKTITVERPVSYFNSMDAYNDVNVILHSGATGKVEITGGSNIIDGIITSVENDKLIIRNENKCNWVRDFKNKFTVDVWVDSLNFLTNYGSGNITFRDTLYTFEFEYDNWNASGSVKMKFNGDRIHVNIHTGSADLEVSGFAGINYLHFNGYGYMNFKELKTHITYITSLNSGDCRINVRDDLIAKISYIGNIYYSGNPHNLITSITGTGQLIHE
jgi:putative autotransporter adhesin-like protein